MLTSIGMRSALVAFLSLIHRAAATYTLRDTFSGAEFFDIFDFFTGADPTNGFVTYVDHTTALSGGLIGLSNHSLANNSIYLGTDYTKTLPSTSGAGRESVRVTSRKTWNHGLVVIDVYHAPTGCGLWPAIWMVAPEGLYPGNTGEIDIIEGVHNMTTNSMTLHTSANCAVSNTSDSFTGTLRTSDCYVAAPGQGQNAGCSIQSPTQVSVGTGNAASAASSTKTFAPSGKEFNEAGGGVYAMLWTSEKIAVYIFPRSEIPPELLSTSPGGASSGPDPSSWKAKGYMPLAEFEGCDLDKHVADLALVVNTDFCGGWAGQTWKSSGCAASTGIDSCEKYVADTPSAFEEGYWLLGGIEVWGET